MNVWVVHEHVYKQKLKINKFKKCLKYIHSGLLILIKIIIEYVLFLLLKVDQLYYLFAFVF